MISLFIFIDVKDTLINSREKKKGTSSFNPVKRIYIWAQSFGLIKIERVSHQVMLHKVSINI
jgi:hypothetical protein